MAQPHPVPALPIEPAWDITFTRLALAVQPRVEAGALDLARRFQAIGLESRTQVRQTPRGLSTFVALVGQRGLVCIVDMTLVDGMAVGQGPCTALDIRLLDACGDVVADGLAGGALGRRFDDTSTAPPLQAESLAQAATAVYVAIVGHFDLPRPGARPG
jgi:hypothetical protein